MSRTRRQAGWVPIAAMRSETECIVAICHEQREHWRVVVFKPRVRKAWVVLEYEGQCPAEARRNVELVRRLIALKPDPSVWKLPAHSGLLDLSA